MAKDKPAAPARAGLAAMILGIAGLTFSNQAEVFGFGGFVVITGILGIVLGIYSRMKGARTGGKIGIILGLLVLYFNLGISKIVVDAVDGDFLGLTVVAYLLLILDLALLVWVGIGVKSAAAKKAHKAKKDAEEKAERKKDEKKKAEKKADEREEKEEERKKKAEKEARKAEKEAKARD